MRGADQLPGPPLGEWLLHVLRARVAIVCGRGVKSAVVSNIAFDLRPAFRRAGAQVDEFVLSYEVGAVKPDPRIFHAALDRLGVAAADAVMVGDSEENDGAARAVGCDFVLVDPLPTDQRPRALIDALLG